MATAAATSVESIASGKLCYNILGVGGGNNGNLHQQPCEQNFFIRQTLDRGINESGVLHFAIPADPECFTDTSESYMMVELRVVRADGSRLKPEEDDVFLVPGSLQALFKTCSISLNGTQLPPNDAYAFVGTLVSYLGSSKISRNDMWDPLSGWDTPMIPASQLSPLLPNFVFAKRQKRVASSRLATFYGRITSDFLMSCTQLLPPGFALSIDLYRSPDAFALASPNAGIGSENTKKQGFPKVSAGYKIQLESASVFIKRVRLAPSLLALVRNQLNLHGGGHLRYNRLTTIMQHVPESSVVFRWNDIYNNGQLPHSLYIGLVKQRAYYGSIESLSTYFETAGLRMLRVQLNGRDVLPVPFTASYVYTSVPPPPTQGATEAAPAFYSTSTVAYPDPEEDTEDSTNKMGEGKEMPKPVVGVLDVDESEALGPFLGLCQMLGTVSQPGRAVPLSYEEYLQGCTLYCIPINNRCNNLDTTTTPTSAGALDLEIEFATPTSDPLMCLCFGEFDKSICFSPNFNIY